MRAATSMASMTTKTFAAACCLSLLSLGLLAQSGARQAQDKGLRNTSFERFVGTWKGLCEDDKEFVVLILKQAGTDIAGTISLGNFGGPEGQCTTVNDPPSEEHAMRVTDAQLKGAVLAFKGKQGTRFEMGVVDAQRARLKFLGTPVEDNPWELKRVK